jgi:hypothetical protein
MNLDYAQIGMAAEEAAAAAKLPLKVASVYLNCTKWEITFCEDGAEGREFLALVSIRNSDTDIVQYEIKRQLLQQYAAVKNLVAKPELQAAGQDVRR